MGKFPIPPERTMSSSGAKLISRKPSRASLSVRRRGVTARDSLRLGEMIARRAWHAAVRLRETIHHRIVAAFHSQVEGSGPGPTDIDLRLFARIAIAEERLRRALQRAKVHQCLRLRTVRAPCGTSPPG